MTNYARTLRRGNFPAAAATILYIYICSIYFPYTTTTPPRRRTPRNFLGKKLAANNKSGI